MDVVKLKYDNLEKALESLHKALVFFDRAIKTQDVPLLGTHEEVYQAARDSVIQRFEFSVELFWKYIRVFLEKVKQMPLESIFPSDVVRSACHFRLISEEEAQLSIDMIKSRNLTSHIYKEDVAEQLARDIPLYYEHMKKVFNKLDPHDT